MKAAQLTQGSASTRVSRPTGADARPTATTRRMGRGMPRSIGATGAPIHRSGGATTIRSRCWIM